MTPRHQRILRGAIALVVLFACAGLSSCSRRLGWGVVLWTAPEGPLPAGSVVPVYIRSNINKLYVVGMPDSKKKIELPLWQVELYSSRRKAEARVAEFGAEKSLYLIAGRDGLPVREKPSNGARRVYRLREGQSVKVLAKAEGEVVSTGGEVLEGRWYYVLTDDGSRGYVFSNTMRAFDESKERAPAPTLAGGAGANQAARADLLFSRSWRPEFFQEMLDDGHIDLETFNPRYGLFTDAVRRQIRVELPKVSKVFDYSSLGEEGGELVFEETPLRVRFDGDTRLVASWSGRSGEALTPESAAGNAPGPGAVLSPGESGRATFVVLSREFRDIVRDEELRRQKLLDAFLAFGEEWEFVPPATESADAGGAERGASRLSLSRSRRFTWTGVANLPSGYVPEGAELGSTTGAALGEVAFRLFMPPSLTASWDGALSLRFDHGDGGWNDYLYRLRDASLELVPAVGVSGLEVGAASSLPPLRFVRPGR